MKRILIAYHLYFDGPLHIGDHKPFEYGNSLGHIPSDTLYAALMAVGAKYGMFLPADGNPGYIVSSLFPFFTPGFKTGEDLDVQKAIRFFPKPLPGLPVPEDKSILVKKLKKVEWVDEAYFSKVLNGDHLSDYGGPESTHIYKSFLSSYFEVLDQSDRFYTVVYGRQTEQRVLVPRQRNIGEARDNENQLFAMERLFFKPGAGLYFLFDGSEDHQEELDRSLNLLALEGLGTDRSVGNGCFTWRKSQIEIEVPEISDHFITLGYFHPENQNQLEQLIDDTSVWSLVKRGGWITDPAFQTIRKRSVYMFGEASIFKKPSNFSGDIGLFNIDLQPNQEINEFPNIGHPIWRNGRSLTLPFNP